MATFNFSALTHNQVVAFDALADELVFDSASMSAAVVSVAGTATGTTVVFTYAGKKITLSGVNLRELSTANISFADGSRLIVGDNATGTSGDQLANTLVGTARADQLNGQGGADTMSGGAGNDTYIVNTASDVVVEAANGGTDRVRSSVSLTLGSNVEILELLGTASLNATGNALNNTLVGNAGNNTLDGGAGIDAASYARATAGVTVSLAIAGPQNTVGAGSDQLDGIESLIGSRFNDHLTGNSGNNILSGGEGDDRLYGNAGNDTIRGGFSDDTLDGGEGSDLLDYSTSDSGVSFYDVWMDGYIAIYDYSYNGVFNNDTVYLGTFERVRGSEFDDHFRSSPVINLEIDGGAGNDFFEVQDNSDTLFGGAGIDTVSYRHATDAVHVDLTVGTTSGPWGAALTLSGFEGVIGSEFNDTLIGGAEDNVLNGDEGNDLLMGGEGFDIAEYTQSSADLTVTLATTLAQDTGSHGIDRLFGFEGLRGSGGNDSLTGNDEANLLEGSFGDDTLSGGAGNDTINGGSGNDVLGGGSGTDTLTYASASAGVTVSLLVTTAQSTGGSGTDTLSSGFEVLIGSRFGDRLTGSAGANRIEGGAGSDTIVGSSGSDTLIGGAGADWFALTGIVGSDVVLDYNVAADTVAVTLSIGDGDTVVEGAAVRDAPGGFSAAAELVIFTTPIDGTIDATSAAATIGSATSAYQTLASSVVFVVGNGQDTAVYRFFSFDSDAVVEANELTLLMTLQGTTGLTAADFAFSA